MLHAFYSQENRVDSQLFLIKSQTGSLTFDPSFGHNLCFKCSNEQYKSILDIYIPRTFQWYNEHHKPWSFDSWNRSLKFQESTGTPSPKVGVVLGVWGLTPSYSLTLSYTPGSVWCDSRASFWPASLWPFCFDFRAPTWPTPLQPLCLGHEPKARAPSSKCPLMLRPLCK
jgi:hypothetical protein